MVVNYTAFDEKSKKSLSTVNAGKKIYCPPLGDALPGQRNRLAPCRPGLIFDIIFYRPPPVGGHWLEQ
jgi:hypothetical protein